MFFIRAVDVVFQIFRPYRTGFIYFYFSTDIMSLAGPIFSRPYGMHDGPIGTLMFVEIERDGNPVPVGTICFFSGCGCCVSNIPRGRVSFIFIFYRHYVPSGTNIFASLRDA